MSIQRVVPNIASDRVEQSKQFYTALLGFQVAMDMDWIVTLASPHNETAQISLVVDAVYATARLRGDRIVYPLTDESWGVRRFHVTDPSGVVVNVLTHLP